VAGPVTGIIAPKVNTFPAVELVVVGGKVVEDAGAVVPEEQPAISATMITILKTNINTEYFLFIDNSPFLI
jgi:hypothetical protein